VSSARLAEPLTSLPGIGPTLAARLAERGLVCVEDLIWFVPRRFDDLRRVVSLAEALAAPVGERVTFAAEVGQVRFKRVGRRFLTVTLRDGPARLTARWFGVPASMAERFVRGARVVLSGPLREREGVREATQPELVGDAEGGGIRPRYPAIEGVAPAILRKATREAVARGVAELDDGLPAEIAARLGLPSLGEALTGLHAPAAELSTEAVAELDRGESVFHRRLAFDELFFLALAVGRRRVERLRGRAPVCPPAPLPLATIFPFALTAAQQRVIAEIVAAMGEARPMGRLLQGDVGAGKTAVAFAAAWHAVRAGQQFALLAPTELLAEQHAASFRPWCQTAGFAVGLLTASSRERATLLSRLAAGELAGLIGTHALLGEGVRFAHLGLAIVDEQHRFGVAQRARLRDKGVTPHLLVMTATPIPRTLALTAYGDLDVSQLDELPAGRQPVTTRVLTGQRGRKDAYRLLAEVCQAGARAFVVCAQIEGEEGALACERRLRRELAPLRIGLVHGQLAGQERDRRMAALRGGELDVLVATTVIEVGVDVPEARVVLVEQADRFGLAQLHQLRGRVGRGGGLAVCLLLPGPRPSDEARQRLAVLAATSDGFRLAEADLALRGPGELLGARQAGLPRLRFGDLAAHAALFAEARREAQALLAEDPELTGQPRCARVLADRLTAAAAADAG
jgi:ATP-dependent DNA helicase RecG